MQHEILDIYIINEEMLTCVLFCWTCWNKTSVCVYTFFFFFEATSPYKIHILDWKSKSLDTICSGQFCEPASWWIRLRWECGQEENMTALPTFSVQFAHLWKEKKKWNVQLCWCCCFSEMNQDVCSFTGRHLTCVQANNRNICFN